MLKCAIDRHGNPRCYTHIRKKEEIDRLFVSEKIYTKIDSAGPGNGRIRASVSPLVTLHSREIPKSRTPVCGTVGDARAVSITE